MGTLGIDFGTVGIRGVHRDGGNERIVQAPDGSSELPSAVSIAGSSVKVGRSAVERAVAYPAQSSVGVRDVLMDEHPTLPDGVADGTELVTHVLRAFQGLAAKQGISEAERVFVTSPPLFVPAAVERLRDSCIRAGYSDVTIVPEPICAAANLVEAGASTRHVLLVDLGAGAISVSILRLKGNHIEMLSWVSVPTGGASVDERLVKNILFDFGIGKVEPMFREMIRQGCEAMKRDLGSGSSTSFRLPCPVPDGPPDSDLLELDRQRLDTVLVPFLAALQACVEAAQEIASLAEADAPEVLLVGRMAHMPAVRDCLGELFVDQTIGTIHPTMALARGAAILGDVGATWEAVEARGPTEAVSDARSKLAAGEGAVAARPKPAPDSDPEPAPETDSDPDPEQSAVAPEATTQAPPRDPEPSAFGAAPAETFRPSMPEPPTPNWRPTQGPLHNPQDPASVLRLALVRPVSATDLNPISGPVLLRMLARPDITGTLTVTNGEKRSVVHIGRGQGYATSKEFTSAARKLLAQGSEYSFGTEFEDEALNRERQPLIRIVVEGLRSVCRGFAADDIARALGPRLRLSPKIRPGRERLLKRMGLMSAEQRFVRYSLDGLRSADDLTRTCGIGRNRGMQVLLVLLVCDVLDFVEPEYEAISLADQLEQLAESNRGRNHFEVLEVHWSVLPDEIELAYRNLKREYAAGSEAHEANPDAVREILEQVEVAYTVLGDSTQRPSYRVEAYPDVDYRMIDDLLEQQRKAVELHDEQAAERVRHSQLDIRQSRAIQGRRTPAVSIDTED